jgi:hypothetical protein
MLKNIYHQFLDIPIDPKIDLFSNADYDPAVYHHIKIQDEQINPELIQWLTDLNIVAPGWFEAFYTPANGGKLPIHIDTTEICEAVKLNWTYGDPGSKLIWWKINDISHAEILYTHGQQYLLANEMDCTKILEVEISKPSLVNAGQFHSTYNPTNKGRWTLSLPLMPIVGTQRLDWNQAITTFQDYLYNPKN